MAGTDTHRQPRLERCGRVALALVAALVVLAAAAPAQARVVRTQRLALLLRTHTALSAPDGHARVVDVVRARRPLTGERTNLPVLGLARGGQGVLWLHVLLPGRPNGHTGWIRQRGTRNRWTRWAVVVDLAHRRVRVYLHGRPVETFAAVVGKTSTPTPLGRFFVEESLRIIPGYPGGPYALALSARSSVYQEFDGGPGQIAVHGIYGIGGTPGTAVSHGCIRLAGHDMAWLGARIHPGVPVTVVG
jgi:lipoprotein-anchoring transpeptidase ErfK/SrfK